MKSTDLRIGNIISHGKNYPITEVSGYELYQLTVKENCGSVAEYYHEWEPVELTEDWLRWFGFKNWGDKYTFSVRGLIIHHRKRGFVVKKSIQTIKYVHQLQNLYFAITGEELKQKEGEMKITVEY